MLLSVMVLGRSESACCSDRRVVAVAKSSSRIAFAAAVDGESRRHTGTTRLRGTWLMKRSVERGRSVEGTR